MKNIAFWSFLVFVLMTVCLLSCDQAQNMTNGIIMAPAESEAPSTPDGEADMPPVAEQPQEKPPDSADQSSEVEELLEEIRRLSEPETPPESTPETPPESTPEPPSEPTPGPTSEPGLQIGDEVIVRNTLNSGILILNAPGGDRIGGMFDGETGIVIADTRESIGLIWAKIEWDAPVKHPLSGCGKGQQVCIGWSAVFIEDGTRIIHKQ